MGSPSMPNRGRKHFANGFRPRASRTSTTSTSASRPHHHGTQSTDLSRPWSGPNGTLDASRARLSPRPQSSSPPISASSQLEGIILGLLTTRVVSRFRVHAQKRQLCRQFQFDADLMPLPIVRRFLGTITEHILRSQFGPNPVGYGRHLIRILQNKRPSPSDLRDVR